MRLLSAGLLRMELEPRCTGCCMRWTCWIYPNLKDVSIGLCIDPIVAVDGLDHTECPAEPPKVSRIPGVKRISRGVSLKFGPNLRGVVSSQPRPFISAVGVKNLRARIVKMSFGCGPQVFRGN